MALKHKWVIRGPKYVPPHARSRKDGEKGKEKDKGNDQDEDKLIKGLSNLSVSMKKRLVIVHPLGEDKLIWNALGFKERDINSLSDIVAQKASQILGDQRDRVLGFPFSFFLLGISPYKKPSCLDRHQFWVEASTTDAADARKPCFVDVWPGFLHMSVAAISYPANMDDSVVIENLFRNAPPIPAFQFKIKSFSVHGKFFVGDATFLSQDPLQGWIAHAKQQMISMGGSLRDVTDKPHVTVNKYEENLNILNGYITIANACQEVLDHEFQATGLRIVSCGDNEDDLPYQFDKEDDLTRGFLLDEELVFT